MYSNHYQYPVYETSFNTPSTQPIHSNQYGPIQYANNTYVNQASQPINQSAYSQPPVYSIPPQQPGISIVSSVFWLRIYQSTIATNISDNTSAVTPCLSNSGSLIILSGTNTATTASKQQSK